MSDHGLSGLNRAQGEAVATLRGPLLVLAGAGTGKTRVITHRIANLIRHGTPPDRILAVTFTNKAAREMRERATKLLGGKLDAPPTIATFHSLCVRILRRHADRLGLPPKFAIYDRGDQESLARSALRELKIETSKLKPGLFLSFVGQWKMKGLGPARVEADILDDTEKLAWKTYRRYQQMLRTVGALDFDDLLLCTLELFNDHPLALEMEQGRFDHVLVDEYQDTNLSQYRILQYLCKRHDNLCVVGDDDQSIYGWRGAEVRHILGFDRDFPRAKVVRLEENYRSCPNIIKLANQLIRRNLDRHDKTLRAVRPANDHPRFAKYEDEQAEAEGVVRDLCATAAKENLPWRSFAILFRTNEQPRLFETELRARNVPYVLVGGYSFFDRREVRDILAYLKVVANPADEVSLLRIINTPARGIGPGIVEKLLQRATSAGLPLWNILPETVSQGSLPSKATAALGWFVELIQTYQERLSRVPLVGNIRELIDKVGYRAEIARNHESPQDQEARWAAIGEILNMIEQYERRADSPSLVGFLEEVTLDTKDDQKEDETSKNRVTLMTLHSAKGLEFPHVYLVGMEERLLPHERSLDSEATVAEERRLAYVGITRARDRLTITRAQFRSRFGQRLPTQASRFLPEMYGATAPQEGTNGTRGTGSDGVDSEKPESGKPKSSPPRGFRQGRYTRKPRIP